MASSSDRARFYLEQSVPELQELLRKDVFTKDEVSAIARKRSDFEHAINIRGCDVADFVRYAVYEQNLEALKKKRLQRLGIKNFTHGGQRRIFFIFERATKKFPGDLQLWMQYLDHARSVKAHKRIGKILTTVLRLHPTKSELWTIAARHAIQSEGELLAARAYLQRGLRFCPKERSLWLEYCRVELMYIDKTSRHLRILGVSQRSTEAEEQESSLQDQLEFADLANESQIVPATVVNSDDRLALNKMAATPALSGAIPIAIFDSAMKEFNNDSAFAARIFDVVADFHSLACCQNIAKHILNVLQTQLPTTSHWAICSFRLPLVGIEPTSSQFPMALRHALQMLRAAMAQQRRADTKFETATKAITMLLPLSVNDSIDEDVRKVIKAVLKQMTQVVGSTRAAEDIVSMHKRGQTTEAKSWLKLALKLDTDNERLQSAFAEIRPAG